MVVGKFHLRKFRKIPPGNPRKLTHIQSRFGKHHFRYICPSILTRIASILIRILVEMSQFTRITMNIFNIIVVFGNLFRKTLLTLFTTAPVTTVTRKTTAKLRMLWAELSNYFRIQFRPEDWKICLGNYSV